MSIQQTRLRAEPSSEARRPEEGWSRAANQGVQVSRLLDFNLLTLVHPRTKYENIRRR
jgi:hypothetical protein